VESSSTKAPPSRRRNRQHLSFVVVLLALNLLFRLPAVFGQGALPTVLLPSLDAVLLVLIVCLWAWLRLPGEGVLGAVLAGLGLFVLAFRSADTLVPLFFNRPLVLHSDLTYVPDLYALLRDTTSPWLFYPGVALLALLLAAVGYGLYRAFRVLYRSFGRPPYRYIFAGLALGLLVPVLMGLAPVLQTSTLPRIAQELDGLAHRSSYLAEQQLYFETQGRDAEALSEGAVSPLDRLGGRHVLMFIVESYGYTLYSEPRHFEPIEGDLRRYEAALAKAGYSVVSAFLRSTAFGGNSWLADSTLSTGLKIDNQSAYELLLDSNVKPMAQYFNEAGYRSVVAMPATTSSWPEGEFFRFQKKYYFRDFGYRGPNLKWAPMTDQFVLDAIHRREVAAAEQPLLLQYVLISSHYPFNLIPRYFEDWSVIGDGSIYAREDSVTVLPIPPGSNTAGPEGYVAAMRYELNLITEYVTRFLPDDDRALVVVLGDHQPYSGVTGKGKPWSVPIHVVSRDPQVLEPFRGRGYTPGWIPRQSPPHPGMETFLPGFLEDFSSAPAGLAGGADDAS
jgi:hypothetical protein